MVRLTMFKKHWFCLKTFIRRLKRKFLAFTRRFTTDKSIHEDKSINEDIEFIVIDEVDLLMPKNSNIPQMNTRSEVFV